MSFIPWPGLDSWFWRLLENYIYHVPDPPPKTRTKPMQVLCLGVARSGTESLQVALLRLGFDHTYHGWDMLFDDPAPYAAWGRLARRKFYGGKPVTREDFDALLGHAVAVTDTAAYSFAEELIEAYPEAKLVLNYREDLDAWHESFTETLVKTGMAWPGHIIALFEARMWWAMHGGFRLFLPNFLGMPYGSKRLNVAAKQNGKMAYRNYYNKIRGLVPKSRLLEWKVEDGWEPLCQFLGKDVPDEPFPHVNAASSGYKGREDAIMNLWVRRAARNFVLLTSGLGLAVAAGLKYNHFISLGSGS